MEKISISIWVTEECNMQCTYCYEKNKSNRTMTTDSAQKIIYFIKDTIKRQNIKECVIHFHGGEPLLNPKVVKILIDGLSKTEKVKMYFTLTTNGTIYSEAILKDIICRLNEISISIDGTKSEQKSGRLLKGGHDSYDTVISNMRKLAVRGIYVTARMTVTQNNVYRLYENTMDLYKNGIYHITNSIDYWNGLWTNEELLEYYRQSLKIEEMVKQKKDLKAAGVLSSLLSYKGGCMGGINNLTIDTEGNIYPCMMTYGVEKWIIGTIIKGINSTWENELLQLKQETVEECRSCEYERNCMGRRCILFRKLTNAGYPIRNICRIQKCLYDLEKQRMEGV